MHNLRTLSLACLLVMSSCFAGQGKSAPAPFLDRQVESINIDATSPIDALLQIARNQRIPLAVEGVGLCATRGNVTIRGESSTLRVVMNRILSACNGYTELETSGVVTIRGPYSNQRNLAFLGVVLPDFRCSRTSLMAANNLAWMTLDQELTHSKGGYAGTFHEGVINHQIGPFSIRSETLRNVLNTLVAAYKDAAWVAIPARDGRANNTSSDLWRLIQYDDPAFEFKVNAARSALVQVLEELEWK